MKKVMLIFGFVLILSMFTVSAFFPMTGKVIDQNCVNNCVDEKCDKYQRVFFKRICENRNIPVCQGECSVSSDVTDTIYSYCENDVCTLYEDETLIYSGHDFEINILHENTPSYHPYFPGYNGGVVSLNIDSDFYPNMIEEFANWETHIAELANGDSIIIQNINFGVGVPEPANVVFSFVEDGESNEIINCTDSDGGRDFFIQGTTTGIDPNNQNNERTETDSCSSDTRIIEYECEQNGEIMWNGYACPLNKPICQNGACISNETQSNCTDSDGGIDYYVKGTTMSPAGPYEDHCLESMPPSNVVEQGPILREHYCNPSSGFSYEYYNCTQEGKVCQNGACIEELQKQSYCTGNLCRLYEGEIINEDDFPKIPGDISINYLDSVNVQLATDGNPLASLISGQYFDFYNLRVTIDNIHYLDLAGYPNYVELRLSSSGNSFRARMANWFARTFRGS